MIPVSSAEWREKGAATVVRKETDEYGHTTTKVVKKGVDDFEFKYQLGEGSYSTVVAASDKQTLREYAVKVLDKRYIIKEKKVKYVNIEKNTLNRLGDHPGIIRLYYTFQDEQSLYFVLDFATNGELLALIKRLGSLNEECARYYGAQLLDAIDYMHSKGVIHRDLKPENILLDYKMRIKITDFGTAKLLDAKPDPADGEMRYPDDVRANSFVGTAEYVSPELLTKKAQGKGADLWAFACVMYQMIAGRPPFKAANEFQTFQKIVKLQMSYPPGFSYLVRDLCKKVLVLEPERRLKVPQIKQHEFFQGVNWADRKSIWDCAPPRLQPYKPTARSVSNPNARSGSGTAPRVVVPTPSSAYPAKVSYKVNGASSQASGAGLAASRQASGQRPVGAPAGRGPAKPNTAAGAAAVALATPAAAITQQQAGRVQQQQQQQQRRAQHQASATAQMSAQGQQPQQRQQQPGGGGGGQPPQLMQAPQIHNNAPSKRPPSAGDRRSSPAGTPSGTPSGTPANAHRARPPRVVTSGHVRQSSQHRGSPVIAGSPVFSDPKSPTSPRLELPPLTNLETEWAHILVQHDERILCAGPVAVQVSSVSSAAGTPDEDENSGGSTNGTATNPNTGPGSGGSPGIFSKIFSGPKKKTRMMFITTAARLIVVDEDRRVRLDIPIGVPQTTVREFPFNRRTNVGTMTVEWYNRFITIEDARGTGEWMRAMERARAYYEQANAVAERNAFTAATAAAIAAGVSQGPPRPHSGQGMRDQSYSQHQDPSTRLINQGNSTFLQRQEAWRSGNRRR